MKIIKNSYLCVLKFIINNTKINKDLINRYIILINFILLN